jgi:hypothetical protein
VTLLEQIPLLGGSPPREVAHAIRIVFSHYGVGDCDPSYLSGWTRALMTAFTVADEGNLLRLGQGFPLIAAAVSTYRDVPDGVEILKALLAAAEEIERNRPE